ncbi:MAG: hypothetical protein WAX89_03750 [Alphaproteobacteria bacterium]
MQCGLWGRGVSAVIGAALAAGQVVAQVSETVADAQAFPADYTAEDFLIPTGPAVGASFTVPQTSASVVLEPITPTAVMPSLTPVRGQPQPVSALPRVASTTLAAQLPPRALPNPASVFTDSLLNEDVWQGLDAAIATASLQRLASQPIPSPTVRRLLRKVLLTPALPPEGLDEAAWQASRANVFLGLGLVEDALAVLRDTQPSSLSVNPALAKAWTEATLLAGDATRGCAFVRGQVTNATVAEGDTFWRQALMVCQAVQGEAVALQLSLSLQIEADKQADPQLSALLNAIVDQNKTLPLTAPLQPLHMVLLASYPAYLKPAMLAQLPDVLLKRVLETTQLPIETRVLAGEHVVNKTAKPSDALALGTLYNSYTFDVASVTDPIGTARTLLVSATTHVAARALLWQTANLAELPAMRATALSVLWQELGTQGLPHIPQALLPQGQQLVPTAEQAWFAPLAMRAALAAGESGLARQWWMTMFENKALPEHAQQQRDAMAVIFSLLDNTLQPQVVAAWWQQQPLADATTRARAQRGLAGLEALGAVVPAQAWQQLYAASGGADATGRSAGHLWLRLLADHLAGQRTGAALLLALEPLAGGLDDVAPETLANALTALKFVEFNQTARLLAAEVLLPAWAPTLPAAPTVVQGGLGAMTSVSATVGTVSFTVAVPQAPSPTASIEGMPVDAGVITPAALSSRPTLASSTLVLSPSAPK